MERHLIEQKNQLEQNLHGDSEQHRTSVSNRRKNFDLDENQREIADLIQRDPYIAAAMEDFVRSHRLDSFRFQTSHSIDTSSAIALFPSFHKWRFLIWKIFNDDNDDFVDYKSKLEK